MSAFHKATKSQSKLRLGLVGPPGAGKTWTALSIAKGLGGKVVLIDTENASASKYADTFDFDTAVLSEFSPRAYINLISEAQKGGYGVLIVDSLSHAWAGKGGALEMADNAAKRSKSHNTYTAWRDVTPEHNALVDAIIQAKLHVIATLRTKVEYVLEKDDSGKQVPKKVGLQPITGKGLEYEFDIVLDMDDGGKAVVTKTRYSNLTGKALNRPGVELGAELGGWLSDGVAPVLELPTGPSAPVNWAYSLIDSAKDNAQLLQAGLDIGNRKAEFSEREHGFLRQAYKNKEDAIGKQRPPSQTA